MTLHKNNDKLSVRPGTYLSTIVRWWESEENWQYIINVNGKEMLYTERAFFGEPRRFCEGENVVVNTAFNGGATFITSVNPLSSPS